MPFITIDGSIPELTGFTNYQVYNCLDSAVTAQLLPTMLDRLNQNTAKTYRREMEMQSLCLEMSAGGMTIDQLALADLVWQLERDADKILSILLQFTDALELEPVNPRSPKDVARLFYENLRIPPVYEFDRKTKERKIVTDIKALEKIRGSYPISMPFVNAILAYREATKMASVFKRGLEPKTQNLRCNFSPSGTESGRLSSQQNPYGRGTNGQNITDRVRQVVTAPDGYVLVNFDLKTAESLAVGFISQCRAYIDACLTGDVHTAVARLNWRSSLPWTGDIKQDKQLAERPYYRHFSYRDLAKKGGHATNYYGKPPTVRKVAFEGQVPLSVVEDFQDAYLGNPEKGIPGAFPEIREWHLETIARLQRDGILINAFGRERRFWGRADDQATWREAIAHEPQSTVADVMNEGLKAAQRYLQRQHKGLLESNWKKFGTGIILGQFHDAGLFLLPISEAHDIIADLLRVLPFPVDFGEMGIMTIPFDVSVGRRWNKKPKKAGDKRMSEGQRDYIPGMDLSTLL